MKTVKYIVAVTYDEKSPDGPISLKELRTELRNAANAQLRLGEGEKVSVIRYWEEPKKESPIAN